MNLAQQEKLMAERTKDPLDTMTLSRTPDGRVREVRSLGRNREPGVVVQEHSGPNRKQRRAFMSRNGKRLVRQANQELERKRNMELLRQATEAMHR